MQALYSLSELVQCTPILSDDKFTFPDKQFKADMREDAQKLGIDSEVVLRISLECFKEVAIVFHPGKCSTAIMKTKLQEIYQRLGKQRELSLREVGRMSAIKSVATMSSSEMHAESLDVQLSPRSAAKETNDDSKQHSSEVAAMRFSRATICSVSSSATLAETLDAQLSPRGTAAQETNDDSKQHYSEVWAMGDGQVHSADVLKTLVATKRTIPGVSLTPRV